ncbi:MAG: ROK family transcriptional regulator [Chloroflexota bacterium]
MNRSIVLNVIKTYGPIARVEVARRTGLSPATVTGITAELIDEDLVFEKDMGDSSGGRRPILLAINPSGGYVIGIKLTETQAIGALTDLEATVIVKRTDNLHGRDPEMIVKQLSLLVSELLQKAGLPKKKLLGVGVGLAGIVDSEQGMLRQSPFFGWRDLPLGEMLQAQVRVPVYVDNDVNTLTLAEMWFGGGQGIDSFLIVTVGRGVGLGIVVNGQFYRGARGGAGELGHTVIDPEGPTCECGKHGCLEAYVGDPGLVRMATEAVNRGEIPGPITSMSDLLTQAQADEAGAHAVFARAGDILGQGIANLLNIFNPQKIIISGEGTRAGDLLFGPMRESIANHVMPGLASDTSIQIDAWGDDAWARGAASLVLRQLFVSPLHKEVVKETVAVAE